MEALQFASQLQFFNAWDRWLCVVIAEGQGLDEILCWYGHRRKLKSHLKPEEGMKKTHRQTCLIVLEGIKQGNKWDELSHEVFPEQVKLQDGNQATYWFRNTDKDDEVVTLSRTTQLN